MHNPIILRVINETDRNPYDLYVGHPNNVTSFLNSPTKTIIEFREDKWFELAEHYTIDQLKDYFPHLF